MKETPYAIQLVTPASLKYRDGVNEARLERIYVKKKGTEEIRLSWWKNNQFQRRPVDLPEEELWELLARGIRQGVLTLRPSEALADFKGALVGATGGGDGEGVSA